MGRKRPTPEQIITALREAEVGLARGKSVKLMSRELGITEQTYSRLHRGGHLQRHVQGDDRHELSGDPPSHPPRGNVGGSPEVQRPELGPAPTARTLRLGAMPSLGPSHPLQTRSR